MADRLEEYKSVARAAVDRYLGDVIDDPEDTEAVAEETYTIAHDAMMDLGVHPEVACLVARAVANGE